MGIDISWAVDDNRQPVSLDFVDFVRVYTGLNQKCGWLLETSTEILGAEDLHLEASLKAITTAVSATQLTKCQPLVRRMIYKGAGSSLKAKVFISETERFLFNKH